MTLPEGIGIGLGLLAIVAPALWPTMSKAITYPVATIGFVVLGWSGVLALEEVTGMKIQSGPLAMLICAAALAVGAIFWQVQLSKGHAEALPAPHEGTSVAADKPSSGKNSPNISVQRGNVYIDHLGDVINNNQPDTPRLVLGQASVKKLDGKYATSITAEVTGSSYTPAGVRLDVSADGIITMNAFTGTQIRAIQGGLYVQSPPKKFAIYVETKENVRVDIKYQFDK